MANLLSAREQQLVAVIVGLHKQSTFPEIAAAAATQLGITGSNAAALLNRLEKRGVIRHVGSRRNYRYRVVPVRVPLAREEETTVATTRRRTTTTTAAARPRTATTTEAMMADPQLFERVLVRMEALVAENAQLHQRVEALEAQDAQRQQELTTQREQLRRQLPVVTPALRERLQNLGVEVAPSGRR